MSEILDLVAKVSWDTNEKALKDVNKALLKEDKLLEELRQKGARLEQQMLQTNDPKKLKQYNAELQQTKKNADAITESQKKQLDVTKNLQKEQKNLIEQLKKTNDPNAVKGLLQNLYKVENQMSAMTKKTSDFTSKMGGIGSSILQGIGIGGGMQIFDQIIGGIGNIFANANKEFEEAEISQARFFQTLKNIGQEGLFDELSQMSDKLAVSYKNLFDNDDITNGQIKFIEGTRVTKSELEKLVPVAIELAAKLGTDVTTASEMLVNAIIGRTSPELKRLGLDMKGAGDETERVNRITGDFANLLTGSVDSALQTTIGRTQQLNQEIANLEEELGRQIAPIKKKWLELQLGISQGLNNLLLGEEGRRKVVDEKIISDRVKTFEKLSKQQLELEKKDIIEKAKEVFRIKAQIDKDEDKIREINAGKRSIFEEEQLSKDIKANKKRFDILTRDVTTRQNAINEISKVSNDRIINPNAGQDEVEKEVKKAKVVKAKVEKASKEDPIKLTYKLESDDLNKMANDLAEKIKKETEEEIKRLENTEPIYIPLTPKIAELSDEEAKKLQSEINNRKGVRPEKEKDESTSIKSVSQVLALKREELKVAEKYGTVEEQNALRRKVHQLENILRIEEFIQSYSTLANEIQNVISLEQQKNDALISMQEKRVTEAEKNSKVSLKIEQDRLNELLKKREKYEKAQRLIDASVIVANQAVAISGAIATISSQKNPILIGAQVLAIIAGITSAVTAVRSINAENGFKEGGYTGDGDPNEESTQLGKKSYKYHKGEYVMDADLTTKHRDMLEGLHKRDLMVKEMRNGAYMLAPKGLDVDSMVNAHYTIKNDSNNANLVYEIQGMRSELSKIKMNVTNTFDANGFGQEVATQMVKANMINKLR